MGRNTAKYALTNQSASDSSRADRATYSMAAVDITNPITIKAVLGKDLRQCLICEGIFVRQAAADHSAIPCIARNRTVRAACTPQRALNICTSLATKDTEFTARSICGAPSLSTSKGGAQFAYPKNLYLPPNTLPFTLKEVQSRIQTLIAFRCDVSIVHNGANIPIWRKESGLHAAGRDFLMSRGKEWYARRKHERTAKAATV
jgi:hypothetical protein